MLGSFIIEFHTAEVFDDECSPQIKRVPLLTLEVLEETGPTRRHGRLSEDCLSTVRPGARKDIYSAGF